MTHNACASTGGFPRRSNLRQRHFLKVCGRAGIANFTIHGLRHTVSSQLNDANVPATVIAARLGHTDARTTLMHCTHPLRGAKRRAADTLERVLIGGRIEPSRSPESATEDAGRYVN